MTPFKRAWRALACATVLLAVAGVGTVSASQLANKQDLPPLSDRVKTHEALRLLSELGYDAGAVDATMALNIEMAIREFQRTHNLPIDGKVTDDLLTALRNASY